MTLESKFRDKYSQYLDNFKELSYDSTKDESLCQDTIHQYHNFDKITKDINHQLNPASPDTVIFKDKTIYCVEFKNSFKRIKAKIIKKKLKDGHQVLSGIIEQLGFDIKDYHLVFCVVYTNPKQPQDDKWQEVHNREESQKIRFEIKQHLGKYFDEIYTNNVDFFRKQFTQKIDPNLSQC